MKKIALILSLIMSVLLSVNCSKKSSPSSPDASTPTPGIQETLTYLATAGATAQAAATQTMVIQQTSTAVAVAQQTATYAAMHGTSTPTINSTATAQMVYAIETATAQMSVTVGYLAQANPTEQDAATQTQTAAIGNATATAVAQKTANSLVTAVVVTCTYTYTPTNIIPPTITNTPTPSTTPASLPVNIHAYFDYYDNDTPDFQYDILVQDANYNNIQNAVVTVKNVTKSSSFPSSWINDGYSGAISGVDPGNTIEVDVYFSGVTYTASGIVPGNSNLSPDGNTLSWQYNGTYVNVDISDPSGNNIYSGQPTGNSVDISSFYPLTGVEGEYQVNMSIENTNITFTGGASTGSNLYLDYYSAWIVDVVLVSKYAQPTPTPTPLTTAPTIIGEIYSSDLEQGVVVQDMVMVTGNDGNSVTDANVIIKDITAGTQLNLPYVPEEEYQGVINGNYFLSGANCVAGDTYEFDVFTGGVTYTARVTAPVTSANISADCDTLTWSSNGNYNDVNDYRGFDKINVPGNSMDISSMYTSADTYDVNLFLANVYSNGSFQQGIPYSPAAFAGAAAPSLVAVGYDYLWDVEVTY